MGRGAFENVAPDSVILSCEIYLASGGSRGGTGTRPPLSAKISSFSCSFREKLGQ